MNRIINKFLQTGGKFMPELHLKQPGFTQSDYLLFTIHLKRIKKFGETDNSKYLYKNKLDKSCFTHNATYSHNNDLVKRTLSDKILKDRAYEIARNCGYHGSQGALANVVQKFLDKSG